MFGKQRNASVTIGLAVAGALLLLGALLAVDAPGFASPLLGVMVVMGAVAARKARPGLRPAPPGTPPSPWAPLLHELERGRRYGTGFTLVRLPARQPGVAGRSRRLLDGPEGQVLPLVRETDLVWSVGPFLYLLLPCVGLDGAGRALNRIAEHEPADVWLDGASAAVFPDDGLTSNSLLATLDDASPQAQRPTG